MKTAGLLLSALFVLTGILPRDAIAAPVGASIVRDLDASPGAGGSEPHDFRRIGERIYFAATEPETGTELYVSNGSSGAAQLVADLARGPASSYPLALGLAGGRLIVAADDGLRGEQLWAVDLADGTRTRLTDVAFNGSGGQRLATAKGMLGDRLIYELEPHQGVWSTDGTAAGTRAVGESTYSGEDAPVCLLGDKLVVLRSGTFGDYDIVAVDASGVSSQWLADGGYFENFRAFGDGTYCYLVAGGGFDAGWAAWRTDGSVAGTQQLAHSNSASLRDAALLAGRIYVVESGLRLRRADDGAIVWNFSLPYGAAPQLGTAGGRLAFFATDPGDTGALAIYLSDGTAGGTRRVVATTGSNHSTKLFPAGSRFLLYAGPTTAWSLAPATAILEALNLTAPGLYRGDFAVLGDAVLLAATDERGEEVWRSDGTGARRLHDVWAPTADGFFALSDTPAAVASSELLFVRKSGNGLTMSRAELWRTDGSEAGTRALPAAAYDAGSVTAVAPLGDGAVFVSVDGTAFTRRVWFAPAGLSSAAPLWSDGRYDAAPFTAGQNSAALFACTAGGYALCGVRSDTLQVTTVLTGLSSSQPYPAGRIGDSALFFIDYPPSARGLWRSDGTALGTQLLVPDLVTPEPFEPSASIAYGGRVLFSACDASAQCGLYASDGSTAGTNRIVISSGRMTQTALLGNRVALLRSGPGSQLMVSDGTPAQTRIVRTFGGHFTSPLAVAGNFVHFVVAGADGAAPTYYVSDGTTAGTRAIALPAGFKPTLGLVIAVAADTVVSSCESATTGEELCVADAAGQTLRLLRDFFPGPRSSAPKLLGRFGDSVYLRLDDGRHGHEPWRLQPLAEVMFRNGFEPPTFWQ